MKNNILVVAAHPDDEILGVGGTIIKHVKNGDQVNILILGDGETSRDVGDIEARARQAKLAGKMLGAKNIILKTLPDNKFDSIPLLQITKEVEAVVQKFKPNIVYTHFAQDLNIDHRLTFQAVLTACRPQPGFCVKKILTFETLSSTEWQTKKKSTIFLPTEYHNITGLVDKKIAALSVYKKELRKYPHPRSTNGVKILAQYRGLEVGYKYAEAFEVVRSLDE